MEKIFLSDESDDAGNFGTPLFLSKWRVVSKKSSTFAKIKNKNMENLIKYVNIHNFKSVADLELKDCRRINLFIGYPNVGKSNVLEALSLFSVPFLQEGESLNKLIRVENKNELFFNLLENTCFVKTNMESIEFDTNLRFKLFKEEYDEIICQFSKKLILEHRDFEPRGEFYDGSGSGSILRYAFKREKQWKSVGDELLLPPFGENIVDTLSDNDNVSEVLAWIKNEFSKYKLEPVFDVSTNSLKIQQRLNSDKVKQLPYSSIADTLQRMIFYKTAIASNKNSVLLFEEPEAHAFPPYIATIMNDIIDAESNRFFIVTHSPIVVNAFLEYEKVRRETSIYLFDLKNGQTIAKRLSDEEMALAYEYGDDLFFNLENLL
ncbi:MAG: AAA family ATPase [Prevotellaceae bacterium]|nr:AAA family ATPase [Prevotellaceae bacterium]